MDIAQHNQVGGLEVLLFTHPYVTAICSHMALLFSSEIAMALRGAPLPNKRHTKAPAAQVLAAKTPSSCPR